MNTTTTRAETASLTPHKIDGALAFMFETADSDTMTGLLKYVAAQNDNAIHRTIFYFDVLAVSATDQPVARAAVTQYMTQFWTV